MIFNIFLESLIKKINYKNLKNNSNSFLKLTNRLTIKCQVKNKKI